MTERICAVDGCGKPVHRRAWCSAHYQRVMKRGSTDLPTWEDRFWAKVNKTETCWLWIGAVQPPGYGAFGRIEGSRLAHRIAYELLAGPIPDGLTLDHLCRVPPCVRPDHLEPVTRAENVLRGVGWAGVNRRKTHCPRDHVYDEANTYVDPLGYRHCRACRNT